MSYRQNPIKMDKNGNVEGTQINMFSEYYNLSPRYRRDLQKGWAGAFRVLIMPNIDESPYSALYSELPGRPNTPVNWTLGALILKEIRQIPTDDDLREKFCYDMEYRYAIACENYMGAPFSDNLFTDFRRRCIQHYVKTGVDLIYGTFLALREPLEKLMEIDPSLVRIDSTMVAATIREMNRLALLYISNELMLEAVTGIKIHQRPKKEKSVKNKADIINGQIRFTEMSDEEKKADKKARESAKQVRAQKMDEARALLPKALHHYLDKEDENVILYHNKEQSYDERINQVVSEAQEILQMCEKHPEYRALKQYDIFVRILNEQCRPDEEGTYSLRQKGEGMTSDMVQSPYDTEATYRSKDGESHKGYVVAFTEAQNADGESLMMDYEVDKNNVSDQELGERIVSRMDAQAEDAGAKIVGDSLFAGDAMEKAAADKNYEVINTNMTGKRPPDHCADHEFDEEGNLTKCAGGAVPTQTKVNKDGSCTAKIEKTACEQCPYKEECGVKEQKNSNTLKTSVTTKERAEEIRERGTEEFRKLSHFRNGVESVPSLMKNKYKINKIRGDGLARRIFQIGIGFIAIIACQGMAFLDRRLNYT